MRGRRHDVRVGKRAGMDAGRDESRDMRDVGHEQRANTVGDLPEFREVDNPRISRGARHNELWLVLFRELRQPVVVDVLRLRMNLVRGDFELLAREAYRTSVRQVPAMAQSMPRMVSPSSRAP